DPLVAAAPVPRIELDGVHDRRCGRACERAGRSGVQVRVALEHGELSARFLERHPTLTSTGAWSESSLPPTRRRSDGHATGAEDGRPRTTIWSMLSASGSEKPARWYGGRRLTSPASTAASPSASSTTRLNCSSAASPPVPGKLYTNGPSSSRTPRSTRLGPTSRGSASPT